MLLIYGIGLFLVAYLVHLIRWRIAFPRNSGSALLFTMLFSLLLGALLIEIAMAEGKHVAGLVPDELSERIHGLLLAMALTAGYVMTYPALEIESPTLVIVAALRRTGPKGISIQQLLAAMTDDVVIHPRISDLINEKYATRQGRMIALTSKGKRLARLFIGWRRLLRLPQGG